MYFELHKLLRIKKDIVLKSNWTLMNCVNILYILLPFSKIKNDKIAIGSKEIMFFYPFM
jgi:hypothetical protein